PRPYDSRALRVDNNWPAESFEEWVCVVAASIRKPPPPAAATSPLPRMSRGSRPRRRRLLLAVCLAGGLAVLALLVLVAVRALDPRGISAEADLVFGEQHLKVVVALLELHKVRYGRYPDTLGDLKFIGPWDEMALGNVDYWPAADRSAYYVEVRCGFSGRPDLEMPEEFWQGTGFTRHLKPKSD
ncbi:MAG: hypothetical protein MUE73_15320, partial [Planctomycetes bacterium]|nr:hypothetical protein [Planctomycetota bacterium]